MAPVIPFLGDHPDQCARRYGRSPLRRHLGDPAGAASAARRARVVHELARPPPPASGAALRAAVRGGRLRPKWYQRRITRQVHELAEEFGIGPSRPGTARRLPVVPPQAEPPHAEATQLTLL
ncbi:hypothetical protein DUI70_7167 [Streptomyces albus]|nr:hypothetical protein DUI70_7167 [Streptomyces albus]